MLKVALEVVHILVRDENMDTEKINPHMAKKGVKDSDVKGHLT